MLQINNLHAHINGNPILKGLNLTIPKGEFHVVMGPNGVGKSTLGHVLMGHKTYGVTNGSITLDGQDITSLDTSERAKAGLFLAFQYPISIPGLKVSEYLRNLYELHHNTTVSVAEFRKILRQKLELLGLPRETTQRYLNDGFSGGEMKRLEMLQLAVIQPKVAVLDEIDSGVDVDGQKIIAQAINSLQKEFGTTFLLITHYHRILNLVSANAVHVVLDGQIARSGGMDLVATLDTHGYQAMQTGPQSLTSNAPGV